MPTKLSTWRPASQATSSSRTLDCLAIVASEAGNDLSAARLFGAADAAHQHMGVVRFKVLEGDDDAGIAAFRDAMGQNNFHAAWAEDSAISIEEAIRLRAAWAW